MFTGDTLKVFPSKLIELTPVYAACIWSCQPPLSCKIFLSIFIASVAIFLGSSRSLLSIFLKSLINPTVKVDDDPKPEPDGISVIERKCHDPLIDY